MTYREDVSTVYSVYRCTKLLGAEGKRTDL